LTRLVAYLEAKFQMVEDMRAVRAYPAETTLEERELQQQPRKVRLRLERVRKRLRRESLGYR